MQENQGNSIRIIYVAGYGHSGSTILEILLSSSDHIIGFGELVGIPRELDASFTKTFFEKNPFCKSFYERIDTALKVEGESLNSITEMNTYEHFFGIKSKKRKARYQKFWSTFLKAASNNPNSSATTFVDSSKTAFAHVFRPYNLHNIEGVDVSMVHIVRHPLSILTRFKRKEVLNNMEGPDWLNAFKRTFKTFLNWTFSNVLPALLSFKVERYVRISFEDLCEFPVETLKKIEQECQLDLSDSIDRVINDKPLPPTCGIAGNIPVKKQKNELRFQSSKKSIPKAGIFISLLSLPLILIYKLLTR